MKSVEGQRKAVGKGAQNVDRLSRLTVSLFYVYMSMVPCDALDYACSY